MAPVRARRAYALHARRPGAGSWNVTAGDRLRVDARTCWRHGRRPRVWTASAQGAALSPDSPTRLLHGAERLRRLEPRARHHRATRQRASPVKHARLERAMDLDGLDLASPLDDQSCRIPNIRVAGGLAFATASPTPERDGDIRRASFPMRARTTSERGKLARALAPPRRTAGTTGARQPPATRNPGGPTA